MSSVRLLKITVLLLVITCVTLIAQRRTALEGWQPYTPSRLEWLAVESNALRAQVNSGKHDFSIVFSAVPNDNAILLGVAYSPSVNREAMNIGIQTARDIVTTLAKTRGWSSWLKIQEQMKMVEDNK